MKSFLNPEMDIVRLSQEDAITTSPVTPTVPAGPGVIGDEDDIFSDIV